MRRPWWGNAQKARELSEQLERERAEHLDHLLLVCELAGARPMQFGNLPERVYPEQLEQFRSLAAQRGCTVIILTGSGRILGVYGVTP